MKYWSYKDEFGIVEINIQWSFEKWQTIFLLCNGYFAYVMRVWAPVT